MEEQKLIVVFNNHVKVSSLKQFNAFLDLPACHEYPLPLRNEDNGYSSQAMLLNENIALNILAGQFLIAVKINKKLQKNAVKASSMIEDKVIKAFNNALRYMVEQEFDGTGIVATQEIVTDVLCRMMVMQMSNGNINGQS